MYKTGQNYFCNTERTAVSCSLWDVTSLDELRLSSLESQ